MSWIIPLGLAVLLVMLLLRKKPVYDLFVQGAGEGLQTVVKIAPYIIAITVMVSVMRASGLMEGLLGLLAPVARFLGFPEQLLPLVIMRPISGSGSLVLLEQLYAQHGPDSTVARMASVLMGSTETIFYTMAVYLGAVGIKKSRHALWVSLLSMAAGVAVAVIVY